MKQNYKYYIFVGILIILGFIWFNNSTNSENSEIFKKKTQNTKIYINQQLKSEFGPKVSQFFKKQKIPFSFSNKEAANIIISFKEISNWENYQISQNIQANQKIEQVGYNSFQFPKTVPIYLSTKENNQISEKLSKVLKNNIDVSKWSLIAVGDIMLARHVGKKILDSGNFSLPFIETNDITQDADITFANLESPFSPQGQTIFEGMVFGAEGRTIEGLKLAGIDIVSLANNHFGNMGQTGMNYTFDLLEQNDIKYCGGGRDFDQAHKFKIVNAKNLKVAFLGYDGVDSTPVSYRADEISSGLAYASVSQLKNDIDLAKTRSDIIIVSLHAGNEYTPYPNDVQIGFAHEAIDQGADLVIGHHPHVVQKIEIYNGKPIFYSLGNFVFDQMWSQNTRIGLIVKISFNNDNVEKFELIPVKIYDYNQPQIMSENNAKTVLDPIISISEF